MVKVVNKLDVNLKGYLDYICHDVRIVSLDAKFKDDFRVCDIML
jgi:hypothetical protein